MKTLGDPISIKGLSHIETSRTDRRLKTLNLNNNANSSFDPLYELEFKGISTTLSKKYKAMIVFDTGGIEIEADSCNRDTEELNITRRNKYKGIKKQYRNIVLTSGIDPIISRLKGQKIYYYYGETIDNKRHGWGILADMQKIIYEGMWNYDIAYSWYICYHVSMVEMGFRGIKRNPKVFILAGKEATIISDDNEICRENPFFEFLELHDKTTYKDDTLIAKEESKEFYKISNNVIDGSKIPKLLIGGIPVEISNTPIIKRKYRKIKTLNYSILSSYELDSNKKKNMLMPENKRKNDMDLKYIYRRGATFPETLYSSPTVDELDCLGYFQDFSNEVLSRTTSESRISSQNTDNFKVNNLYPLPLTASECFHWSRGTLTRFLASVGLINEALLIQRHHIRGSDISRISHYELIQIGVTNTYSRRFIISLFKQLWNSIDPSDPLLPVNRRKLGTIYLPYIPPFMIKLGQHLGEGAYGFVRKGFLNRTPIVCKIFAFNTKFYDSFNTSTNNVSDSINSSLESIIQYDKDKKLKPPIHTITGTPPHHSSNFPQQYLYKYRGSQIMGLNLYRYLPTPVKQRDWEGKILFMLQSHPNIVKCYGTSQVGAGYESLLLEYCEGGSMDKYVFKDKFSSVNCIRNKYNVDRIQLLSWLKDIAWGMTHVHTCGILHRDLKLSNYFVSNINGVPRGKVGDFGIAVPISDGDSRSTISLFGNVYYAAPEVLRGEGFYEQSDVWSFGITLWEILSETISYEGMNAGLAMVTNAAGLNILQIPYNVPKRLCELLKSMLHHDWRRRPDFRYIAEELTHIISQTESSVYTKLQSFLAV
ncbi:protein kinase domain-containing protein [Cryptosporidium andersoni]|uniref:Protein kinase domain-containing protein n=1 Tax=Cryptosporidium andersoni TaxID=117008 RepID=A0A1J4MU37_9CRYT|nr:protein kinase domain-containing protein [Cryptosporidium andersoni]